MRLNRWVGIGILLSIIWAVGAAIHTHNDDKKNANFWVKLDHDSCVPSKTDPSSCEAQSAKTYKIWMENDHENMAFAALLPIPFAWLTFFILVYVVRAQIVGFRAVVPWKTLTRPKKIFAASCWVCSALFVMVGIVWALNLYVDIQVPVGMSTFQDLTKTGDNLVTVTGTWTRTDLTDDTIASPLQTSKIVCDRAANKCTEALASVSGTTLMVDSVDYEIQSWTADAIVMRKDDLCATEIFTIDLNTKAVTGAGHTDHETNAYCAGNHSEPKAWSLQLANGFQTYWALRQKARPMPLRVIYSLFGN